MCGKGKRQVLEGQKESTCVQKLWCKQRQKEGKSKRHTGDRHDRENFQDLILNFQILLHGTRCHVVRERRGKVREGVKGVW